MIFFSLKNEAFWEIIVDALAAVCTSLTHAELDFSNVEFHFGGAFHLAALHIINFRNSASRPDVIFQATTSFW